MSEEGRKMLNTARQIIEAQRLLAGDILPTALRPLPQLSSVEAQPAPADAGATPAPAAPAVAARPAAAAASKTPPAPANVLPLEALPGTPEEKRRALDELRQRVEKCPTCPLHATRTNVVFGEGDADAQLVFVGEAPGADEDATGRPFVGKAGELLTNMIQAMGLKRTQVYIANILKCRPPNNRTPNPQEVLCCWGFLLQQLQIIRPQVIVTLGNPATHTLLRTTEGITKIRGQWRKLPDLAPGLEGIDVMPTFHPAYVARNYTVETRKKVWDDLQKVMEKLRQAE